MTTPAHTFTFVSCPMSEATHYYHARTGQILASEGLVLYPQDAVLPVKAVKQPKETGTNVPRARPILSLSERRADL